MYVCMAVCVRVCLDKAKPMTCKASMRRKHFDFTHSPIVALAVRHRWHIGSAFLGKRSDISFFALTANAFVDAVL